MDEHIPQFGDAPEQFTDRPGAYAVLTNEEGKLLVVRVRDTYHLAGGGIDDGEDPEQALLREVREEVGCEVADMRYLGKANQYYATSKLGPLRKLGIFYAARVVSIDPSVTIEPDHEVCWVAVDAFLESTAGEFQKWAVHQAIAK